MKSVSDARRLFYCEIFIGDLTIANNNLTTEELKPLSYLYEIQGGLLFLISFGQLTLAIESFQLIK